jgi:hypothetical protein
MPSPETPVSQDGGDDPLPPRASIATSTSKVGDGTGVSDWDGTGVEIAVGIGEEVGTAEAVGEAVDVAEVELMCEADTVGGGVLEPQAPSASTAASKATDRLNLLGIESSTRRPGYVA